MGEREAIQTLVSMKRQPIQPLRSGQFEFYYPSQEAVNAAFAWPTQSVAKSPLRLSWTGPLNGRQQIARVRCPDATYGLSAANRSTVTFRYRDVLHVVVLPPDDITGNTTACTIIAGAAQFSANTTCKIQSRRVAITRGEAARMKRIREYVLDTTEHTPEFIIQIRPLEPAVWYIRKSLV